MDNWKKSRYFAPALMRKTLAQSKVLKKFFKNFQKYLEDWKIVLTFASALIKKRSLEKAKRFLRKIFRKNIPKSLEIWKNWFTFAPLSALKKRSGQNKKVLSKIRIKFFEDIEQLSKFFLSRKREISNNTFEIRAKIYIQNFLQWRVWSWLRMNASGRPNTCKSRGITKVACYFWWRPAHGCVTRM